MRGILGGVFGRAWWERGEGKAGWVGASGSGRGGWGRKTIDGREEKKIFGEYAGDAGGNGRDSRVFEMLRWTIWA